MPKNTTPSYRFHKARNCAVVTLHGRDHYLGAYNSAESWEKYHRLVAEYLAARRQPPPPAPDEDPLTVTELIARYWQFARTHYVKDGQPTSEVHAVKLALKFARRLYGDTPAAEFTPKKLAAVREAMLAHPVTRQVKVTDPATGATTTATKVVRVGLARSCTNKLVGRVKRMFKWAVAEELVPVGVHAALERVRGLQRGRTAARETPRVRPVPPADVEAVLPHLPPLVAAMARVQLLSGCRPQDVVQMRAAEVDRSGAVWEYRPRRHKTQHRDDAGDPDRDRVVYLGPRAQAVLAPLLPADPHAYVFSPRRAEAQRRGPGISTPAEEATRRASGNQAKAPLRE